jgi:cobalt-precorrin 5A hydrolase
LGETLETFYQDQGTECALWFKPKPFAERLQTAFKRGEKLLLICATGIAVRSLAPVIASKLQDPPVLVLDELGQFVIPLLSGHEGGANEWGREVSEVLATQLVLTTAKPYLKPVYTVGMGCERHCPEDELQGLLDQCLAKAGLSIEQIASISSIDIKADEVGLIELARTLGKRFDTWSVPKLSEVEHLLNSKSEYVFKTVGVYGVAESAALVAAEQLTGDVSELVLIKHKTAKATCAIARSFPLGESAE